MYLADGDEEHDNISSRLVSHKEIEENNWDLNIGTPNNDPSNKNLCNKIGSPLLHQRAVYERFRCALPL